MREPRPSFFRFSTIDMLLATLVVSAFLAAYSVNRVPMKMRQCSSAEYVQLPIREAADDWSRYIALRDGGSSAIEVWKTSKASGLNWAESIRMIRSVYSLTLVEAKEIKLRAEGVNMSLEENQERVILPMVEEAARELENEDDAYGP